MSIHVLFEDPHILCLDKPPNLVVTPAETTKNIPTLVDFLKSEHEINLDRGGIVHRLDKDTSGVILVAKTLTALENLQSQFAKRQVKKQYIALAHGFLEEEKTVEGAITRNPKNREKFIVLEEGKQSSTKFIPQKTLIMDQEKLLEIFPDYSKIQLKKLQNMNYQNFTLIDCFPLTGRTHQIRVHLKYIGFPIVGDEKYAGRKVSRLDRRWCQRQFLHAKRIEFSHPQTGETMIIESPLPNDLRQVLSFLNG